MFPMNGNAHFATSGVVLLGKKVMIDVIIILESIR